MDALEFGFIDYVVFFLVLIISTGVGIYFGCYGKGSETTADYMMGGKTMGAFPISMSLIASGISGVQILGVPPDVYKFGASYWLSTIGIAIGCIIVAYVYMPVFHELQLATSYEYLKLRFDNKISTLASTMYSITTILFIPIVIYVPSIALAQVTGLNFYAITIILTTVCTVYTVLGGLKVVVWTDTLQTLIMVGSMLTVLYLGLRKASGFGAVWAKAIEKQRLDLFQMDPDPTIRDSFWAVVVGVTVGSVSYAGVNQICVQRFLTLPTLTDVKISLAIYTFGIATFTTISVVSGLILVALYSDCDPLTTGVVGRTDQLFPYHVMYVANDIPGLPGLFTAGVVSAALSTLSTCLNTISGVIYEDIISHFMPKDTNERIKNNCIKIILVVIATISIGFVFEIQHFGGILQLSLSFGGITSGPVLGLFTLGMLFPFANTKGALYGGITSMVLLGWIVIGSQIHIANGSIKQTSKPLSVDNCDGQLNITASQFIKNTTSSLGEEVFFVYRISFYYYTLIGVAIVLIVGLSVSWTTKVQETDAKDKFLSPLITGKLRT